MDQKEFDQLIATFCNYQAKGKAKNIENENFCHWQVKPKACSECNQTVAEHTFIIKRIPIAKGYVFEKKCSVCKLYLGQDTALN
jgi:hypothetical protein